MQEVERIIRVDHAGEYGAVNIYRMQLLISRYLYKDIVPTLEGILTHEKAHFEMFSHLLKTRNIRHCYALQIWGLGGALLGFMTAILGRNAIWVCINSMESTVLHHLQWQLDFLSQHDTEVHDAVLSIKLEEEEHQQFGEQNSVTSVLYQPISWIVRKSTEFAIWLSTKL